MGYDQDTIRSRSVGFANYLESRGKDMESYMNKIDKRPDLDVGDLVRLPIPKPDRTNTCPKNTIARVMSISDGYAKLGVPEGLISTGFRVKELEKFYGDYDFHVPEKTVSNIAAYRASTAYGSKCTCE